MSWSKSFLLILNLRCEAASELSSRELDESLGALKGAAFWGHLLVCRSCRCFRRQVRLIRAAIRRRDRLLEESDRNDGVLSPEVRHRIAGAIRQATREDDDGVDRPLN